MSRFWSARTFSLLQIGRRLLPFAITALLLAWVLTTISFHDLGLAFSRGPWPWLVFITVVQFVALFGWDTFSLWWLFSQPDRKICFRLVGRIRVETALWTALNLEMGQGVFAWKLARTIGLPIRETLGRCLLVALVDFMTLLALGLLACFLNPDPRIDFLRWICGVGLGALLILLLSFAFVPNSWRRWLTDQPWTSWLAWWKWRHGFWLVLQRLTLFILVLVYAGFGLGLIGFSPSIRNVCGVIPLALLAEALPSAGGMGPKEATLVWLINPADPHQRALLFSFGLIWSIVVMLGRILTGLVGSWFAGATRNPTNKTSPELLTNRSWS